MIKRLLAAATLVVSPTTVLACPNCYASLGGRLLHTYYLSTIFLSLLPFAIIVTVVAVGRNLWRRYRDLPVQESWSPPR
jgi:hypothetical protein